MSDDGAHTEPAAIWPDVSFTPIERALLGYLSLHDGRAVPADELLREVWGYSPNVRTSTVTTTVRRLRAKIEPDPARPVHLVFQRGHGYRLAPREPRRADAPITREALERRLSELVGGDHDWVALLTTGTRHTNLPHDNPGFVGRTDELATLGEALEAHQLITVLGTGGVGKTTLARQAASRCAGWTGGAWFCDLSESRSTPQALAVVARELGLRSDEDPASLLARVLRARGRTLLVLDNFEQLERAARHALSRLLDDVPELTVVVTSRERLEIPREHLVPLDRLSPADAVALLRARIEAVRFDRSQPLDDAVLSDIAELLEGVPLALELAAARARILPLAELRARLKAGFEVLGAQAAGPERHQTLPRAIAWSWDLLSPDERDAMAQVAVFRGGASVQAAEEVVATRAPSLTVITALVDKSMLRTWPAGGGLRLGMFEAVHAYVDEHHPGASATARTRHARWAVRWASTWGPDCDRDPRAHRALRAEADNLVEASRWLVAQGSVDALTVLFALQAVFRSHRVPRDYVGLLRGLRDALPLSGAASAELGLVLSRTLTYAGEPQAALVEVEGALRAVDPRSRLSALLKGELSRHQVDLERREQGLATARIALDLAGREGWEDLAPRLLLRLARALVHRPVTERVAVYEQALEAARGLGHRREECVARVNLGRLALDAGDTARGERHLEAAREIAAAFDDRGLLHAMDAQLAAFYASTHRLEEADASYRRLLDDADRFGGLQESGSTRGNAGMVALNLGDASRARDLLEDAARRLIDAGHRGTALFVCQCYLAIALCRCGALDEAERVHAAVGPAPMGAASSAGTLCEAHLAVAAAERGVGEAASAHLVRARGLMSTVRSTPWASAFQPEIAALARAIEAATRRLSAH